MLGIETFCQLATSVHMKLGRPQAGLHPLWFAGHLFRSTSLVRFSSYLLHVGQRGDVTVL